MSLWAELATLHPALWERRLRTFFLPSAECGSRLPWKRWVKLREAPVKERMYQPQRGSAYVLISVLGTGRAEPLEPRAAQRVSGLAQFMIPATFCIFPAEASAAPGGHRRGLFHGR